jgi:hypothetical protein
MKAVRYVKMRSVWKTNVISLEAFATAEFNEISSGRPPHQDVKIFRRFGNCPHIQGIARG